MAHPAEIAKAREALGTALLLEYKDGVWTKQQVIVPSVKVGDSWTRPLMAQRWIASHAPRKQWRIYRGPSAVFTEDATIDNAMSIASQALGYFSVQRHFETAIEQGNTRAVPIVLADLTEADAREAMDGKAPSALLRRIQRARLEAGYPEHAYDWSTGTIAGTSGVTFGTSYATRATTTTTTTV
jgi:hypothetical protein